METIETEKFWADTWEAWWNGIFMERELWNENVRDIESFFRRLMCLKYYMSIDLYSTVYRVDRSIRSHISHKITRDQIRVTQIGTDIDIQTTKTSRSAKIPYGYIASVSRPTSSSEPEQTLSVYDVTEDNAISKILMYVNSGYKGLSTLTFFLLIQKYHVYHFH
jgi:hypothetical protein